MQEHQLHIPYFPAVKERPWCSPTLIIEHTGEQPMENATGAANCRPDSRQLDISNDSLIYPS
jgi:hypothetical protein